MNKVILRYVCPFAIFNENVEITVYSTLKELRSVALQVFQIPIEQQFFKYKTNENWIVNFIY